MREIPLTKGQVAFVDDRDYARIVAVGKWSAARRRNTYYAVSEIAGLLVYMHRFILTLTPGDGVKSDHRDGNGTNNQRYNLRVTDTLHNSRNSAKRKHTSSIFKGVHLFTRTEKWQAYISPNGKRIHLGYFDNELDAAQAYDVAAREHFGEFARLNLEETK